MSISIIDTLSPLGNFPVANSNDVQCGCKRLDVVLSETSTELSNKATKTYVDEKVASIPAVDVSSKADKTYVDSNFAKKTEIPTNVSAFYNDAGYLKQHQDISGKADVSSVSAVSNRISTVESEQTTLDSRISAIESGTTPEGSEVIGIRTGANGEVYATAGDAVRNQISDINDNLTHLYPISHNNTLYTSKWEQGRYNADVGSIAEKNETDDDTVKALRIRTDLFDVKENIRVDISTGYSAQIIKTDSTGKVIENVSWVNSVVVDSNKASKCAIVIKDNSNANIVKNIGWNVVKITKSVESDIIEGISNVNNAYAKKYEKPFVGIKYTYGGIVATTYDTKIQLNDTEAASKIRIRSAIPLNTNGHFRIESDDGYSANACLIDENDKWKGDVTEGFSKHSFYIVVKKTDNSEISISEAYDHVRVFINEHRTFTFEGGSTGTSDTGYYVQNNDPAAVPIRLRTNPTLVDTPVRIKAKEGYSFGLTSFTKDLNGYKKNVEFIKRTSSGSTNWLDEFVIPASDSVYYCIVIKPNSGNVYSFRVDQYLEFEYNFDDVVNGTSDKFKKYNVLFIGDSITEVNYTSTCNWTRLVTSWFSFASAKNIATGGSGIVRGNENAWNTKIDTVTGDYDLILIMGNMNDYSGNVFNESKLGQFGDTGLTTQYGAVNTFLKKVLDKFPTSKVGWITSTPRQYISGDPDNPDPIVSNGYLWSKTGVFENADKAIIEVCHNYSVPVLDMFHESNLQAWNTTQRAEYFYNDGNSVHPNDKGHMIMAIKIADFIKKNF